MAPQYKYVYEIVAQTEQAERNMKKVTTEAGNLAGASGKVSTEGTKLNSALGTIGNGLGKFALMFGGPVAAISLLKGALLQIEGPADKFEEVVAGGKEALFEFGQNLQSLDFTDFFRNLIEGYERGQKFASMLDELADKTAYNDYIVAGLKAQSAELQETIKNKTLDISVRTEFGEERNAIEEKIMKRTQDIAQKAFIIEKQQWEERNKMSTEEAIRLYESIDGLTGEMESQLQRGFKHSTDLFGQKEGIRKVLSGEQSGGILQGIPKALIEDYAKYLNLLKTGEKDVLVKLFTAYKNIDTVRADSQRAYNMSVRETSMLLNAEDAALGKVEKSVSAVGIAMKEVSPTGGVDKLSGKGFTADINPGLKKEGLMPNADLTGMKSFVDLLKEGKTYNELFTLSLVGLHDTLAAGAESWDDYSKNIGNSIREVISALIAKSVANMISNAIEAAGMTGPMALAVAPMLIALGSGIAKTAFNTLVPAFAEGGIVTGPTIGLMGEYPGARSNPEVIAPLSKLEKLIQPAMTSGEVVFRIGERELVGIMVKANRVNRNIRGL